MKNKKLPKTMKRDPNMTMLLDADVVNYHCIQLAYEEKEIEPDLWQMQTDLLQAKDEFYSRVMQFSKETGCGQVLLCWTAKNNFRKRLNPEYKGHRKLRKPLGYWQLKTWAETQWKCEERPFLEADDVIGILHTGKLKGKSIIVSNDKDFLCIPGKFYDFSHPENGIQEINENTANLYMFSMGLCGDASDGYKGCPGVGPVSVQKILSEDMSEEEMFEAYMLAFKKKDVDEAQALENLRMARILRAEDYNEKKQEITLYSTFI